MPPNGAAELCTLNIMGLFLVHGPKKPIRQWFPASGFLYSDVLVLALFWSISGLKELIIWPDVHESMKTTDWLDHNTAIVCPYLVYSFSYAVTAGHDFRCK